MTSAKTIARIAGLFYLLLIIFGVYAQLFVRGAIAVPGDAAATATNIMANEWVYRLGFLSDLAMLSFYLLLVVTLYVLLRSFGKFSAIFMVCCVLVSTSIMSVNLLNHFAPVILLSGADYLNTFSTEQLQSLAMFSIDLHGIGYLIAQPTFGLWLFPLGYLGWKSGYFPKILSAFLMISAPAYLIDLGILFLLPDYHATLSPFITFPTIIGEFGICLWLLIIGVRGQALDKRKAAFT